MTEQACDTRLLLWLVSLASLQRAWVNCEILERECKRSVVLAGRGSRPV